MSASAAALDAGARAGRARASGRAGWAGATIVALFVAAALTAPLVSPYRPQALAGDPLRAPSGEHLLGTNSVGQDLASQLLWGTRVSLAIALLAGGGTLLLGALVGMVAGWLGGRTDALLMRVVDVFLVIPRLPLLIVIAAYTGAAVPTLAAIIALTSWPPAARVVRSQVLSLRNRTHLRAAVGFGARTAYVLRRHVVPELGLVLAAGFVAAAERAIVLEAGLAFLGLGDPEQESWGSVMRDALDFDSLFFTSAWAWWLVPPVAALSVLILAITLLGVALEGRVNPRLTRHVAGAAR